MTVKMPDVIKSGEDVKTILSAFGVPHTWVQDITGQDNTLAVYLDSKAKWDIYLADAYHQGRTAINRLNLNGFTIIFNIS